MHMSGFWSRAAQDAAEAQDAARSRYGPHSSLHSRAPSDRPRWLLGLSLLTIFVAGATAVVVDWYTGGAVFCTVTNRLSGWDIPLAAHVVMIACAVGFLLSIFFARRALLLSLTLMLTACALLTGIVLVARDSAVTKSAESCSFMGTSTDTYTDHVWWVYVLWGVAVAVLLVQPLRVLARHRRAAD
jgi:hypothetical protein